MTEFKFRNPDNIVFEYGLIVIPKDDPDEGPYHIWHFCGYEKPPGLIDFESLRKELKTDPEFVQELKDIDYRIVEATPGIVQYFKDLINE